MKTTSDKTNFEFTNCIVRNHYCFSLDLLQSPKNTHPLISAFMLPKLCMIFFYYVGHHTVLH